MEISGFILPGAPGIAQKKQPGLLPPLTLAYMGDTIYDLFVRRRLIEQTDKSPHELHLAAAKLVCAAGQAGAFRLVEGMLTSEEAAQYRRGRNAHSGTVPKNASVADYHTASGFEALVGYLYLSGRTDRLTELMDIALKGSDAPATT